MIVKLLISVSSLLLLSACSSLSVGPISAGQDSYLISKDPSSLSSDEDELLASILSQANEYCVEQQRYMEVKLLNEYFNFFGNDSKTTLVFSCLSEADKSKENLAPVVIVAPSPPVKPAPVQVAPAVKEPQFPQKNKLTNYAF